MKRGLILLIGTAILGLHVLAEGQEKGNPLAGTPTAKTTTSRIVQATVYPNSALITREVDVPAGAGTYELIVNPLPPQTVDSSLYSEGSDGIRILTTRYRTRPIREDNREEVRKLQDELEKLALSAQKLQGDLKAVEQNIHLLTKMEDFTAVTAKTGDKSALNSESLIALAKFVMDSRGAKAKEIVGLQQSIQANKDQADFVRRQLQDMTVGTVKVERDAVIVVDKVNAGPGKVRLNYLVSAASWRPQYKFRSGKNEKEAVQVEYMAALMQHTGEDWTGVNVTLSTAQPMLNAAPPDLQVLQVTVAPRGNGPAAPVAHPTAMDLDKAKDLRRLAQMDFNEKRTFSGAGRFNSAAALDQSFELLNPDAAIKKGCLLANREGPSVTYHLKTRLALPSRNDEQIIEVTRLDLAPEYFYKAVPVLTPHVYRLADLTNKTTTVLLPGEATMYIGSDFVGQMNLPLVAIGEQFTVGFGVDPQLQIQRQLVDKSRTTQGGNQVLRYEYRILANSYKAERVKLQVWDRLPHAESDTIGVSLVKTAPEVSKDGLYQREQRPNNLLRWDVSIDPGMSGEKALAINYEFKLDLDRQMTIGSFQTVGVPQPEAAPVIPIAIPQVSAGEMTRIQTMMGRLSPEDRKLAQAQLFCAIDQDSRLGSMGPILKVMCRDKPVFLCCKGCEAEARTNPDETLAKVEKLMDRLRGSSKR